MTNGEKFKTAKERKTAWWKHCAGCCDDNVGILDKFDWLELEHEEELKPCPFCGHTDIRARKNNAKDVCYIFCNGCGCSTGGDVVRDMAIETWNRRVK